MNFTTVVAGKVHKFKVTSFIDEEDNKIYLLVQLSKGNFLVYGGQTVIQFEMSPDKYVTEDLQWAILEKIDQAGMWNITTNALSFNVLPECYKRILY